MIGTCKTPALPSMAFRGLAGLSESWDMAGEAVEVIPDRREELAEFGRDGKAGRRLTERGANGGERRLVTIEAMLDLALFAAALRERESIGGSCSACDGATMCADVAVDGGA